MVPEPSMMSPSIPLFIGAEADWAVPLYMAGQGGTGGGKEQERSRSRGRRVRETRAKPKRRERGDGLATATRRKEETAKRATMQVALGQLRADVSRFACSWMGRLGRWQAGGSAGK